MAFIPDEIAAHAVTIEKVFWSRRRPKLNLRAEIREGQHFDRQSIVLFYARPSFLDRRKWTNHEIAKVTYVRTQRVWRLFWMRADMKWHGYPYYPETETLAEALRVIDRDAYCCFFG